MSSLSVGKLAKLAEVSTVTLRYYERIGLIPAAKRSASGYRLYSSEVLDQLRFIKNAKLAGFSLAEIAKLQSLQANQTLTAKPIRLFIMEKLDSVRQQIAALHTVEASLAQLVTLCDGTSAIKHCPILKSLSS